VADGLRWRRRCCLYWCGGRLQPLALTRDGMPRPRALLPCACHLRGNASEDGGSEAPNLAAGLLGQDSTASAGGMTHDSSSYQNLQVRQPSLRLRYRAGARISAAGQAAARSAGQRSQQHSSQLTGRA
jgi:hypothetical protein